MKYKMKKEYIFGDKVRLRDDGCVGIVIRKKEIPNDSGDEKLKYIYEIKLRDGEEIELGYDDLDEGW